MARLATANDPASEHYYHKIYCESLRYMERLREILQGTFGERATTSLLLRESRRIRTPLRVTNTALLLAVLNIGGGLGPGLVVALPVTLLVGLGIGTHANGRRAARLVTAPRRLRHTQGAWELLDLFPEKSRRRMLRRPGRMPARVLLAGANQQIVLNRIGALDEDLVETLTCLAEEFEGTVDDLILTARALQG